MSLKFSAYMLIVRLNHTLVIPSYKLCAFPKFDVLFDVAGSNAKRKDNYFLDIEKDRIERNVKDP